jgi:competence protein ComEC
MRFILKGIFFLSLLSGLIYSQQLKIYQIDVNTGDAALIVSPTNQYILIDAGHIQGNYGDTVLTFIRNLGITHLNHIITSHYHEDHIGGTARVIYGLSGANNNDSIIGWCYDRGDTYTTATFLAYKAAVGLKRKTVTLGETLDLGGGVIMFCVASNGKVMNGDSVNPTSGENYRSLAWVLEYGLFRFFTAGDLIGYNVSGERDVETKVAPVVRKVDVIKVSHHGSRNSSNLTFLDSLRPQAAIISQGTVPNNNNHPHQEALDRIAARNAYIYQMNTNPSGGVIPTGHGRILNTTAVVTVNQASYTINGDEYILTGVQRDASCLEILSPLDTIAEASIITPRARIQNLGNASESFRTRFRIGDGYNRIQTISGLVPGDTITVVFDTMWYAMRGNYQVTCSTEVYGDTCSVNDKQTTQLTVAFYDSEVQNIIEPALNNIFYYHDTITPTVIIKDNSEYSNPTSIKIFSQLRNNSQVIYLDSTQRTSIPGRTDTVIFTPYQISNSGEGTYLCSVWVCRDNDLITNNNYQTAQFTILDPNGIADEEISTYDDNNQTYRTVTLKLFNAAGRLLNTQKIYNQPARINYNSLNWIHNLRPGIYFVHSTAVPSDNSLKPVKSTRKLLILPH